eukprot:10181911-Alexandrium_andersonii.AAC.1
MQGLEAGGHGGAGQLLHRGQLVGAGAGRDHRPRGEDEPQPSRDAHPSAPVHHRGLPVEEQYGQRHPHQRGP